MLFKNKYSILEKLNINGIYNSFLSLPPQQQTLAMIAAVVVVVMIVLLPISLTSSRINKMAKQLNTSEQEMGNIVAEIEQYNASRAKLKEMEDSLKAGYDTSLSTTIESMASKTGIKENIESIKERPVVPSELFDESIVEVRLLKVTLPQLIDFLYSIEYDRTKVLRVRELRIKSRFDNKQLFDVTFLVSTYKLQVQ